MAGTSYTRQSTLTDGSLITAALFNDEYNQLVNAFAYSATGTTGHTHDGSAGQGGAISKIGDQDFKNKIEISATNNRIECYVEVSGSAVEQIRIQDGAIVPVTDNDVDLGSSSVQFKDLYINGTGNIDSLVLGSGATVTAILDEDNMSSDSATALVTQQSIKAYVDAQVTAQDLDLTDGTTSISIDLDSEALSVLGGTGITSTASGNGVTIAIDSTVATLTGTQTLTNKTLTSPDINGGSIDGTVIGASTAAAGSFTSVSATGDITVGGTVDGRDVAADGTKLDGIEAAATADQTAAEIRTLVESATDSNVFTDADHSKLNAIEANATADQTDAEIRAAVEAATDSNVFTDADHSKLNAIESGATADQTAAEIKTAYESNSDTNAFTDADHTKLDGIEASATADQTDAEIRAAVEAATDSNVFTDADHSKLNAIEASADVTDTANVTSAGALMDSELTAIASVKALNQGVATTDSPTFVNLTLSGTGSVKVPSGTTAQRDGSPVNGMFRYNSTNEQFEGYQSGAWGAIGGGGGSNTFTADTFTGDGSTTAYALSQVINSEDNLLVFIAGVFQQQSAYSIATASGTTTLTFATAPANTREIIVYSVASAVSGSNLNIDSMTGDGSDTTLSLTIAPVNENNTQVFIDGVYQNKNTYSISGTTLTFSTAPPNGSAVEVMTMTQTEVNVPVDGSVTSAKLSGALTTPSSLTVTGTVTASAATPSFILSETDRTDENTQLLNASGDFRIRTRSDDGGTNTDRFRIDHATGDISFYEDTGTTAKLFWDSSKESLGIGTTSLTPTDGANIELSSATSARIILDSTGTGGRKFTMASGTNGSLDFYDYDASAYRMRIDASGNLLVGRTSAGRTGNGHSIRGGDSAIFSRDASGETMQIGRNAADGDLIRMYSNGSQTGAIGTRASQLSIGSADTGLEFNNANDNILPHNTSTNGGRDATIDLGASGTRFKDLYLSGGAYLGGTGSANKLDDYEEGTWTPDIRRNDGTVSATFTVGSGTATYVKIGRLVYVKAFINSISDGSSNGSSYWRINGTPFAGTQYASLLLGYNNTPADGVYIGDAGGNFILTVGASPLYGSIGSNKEFMLAFTYETDS